MSNERTQRRKAESRPPLRRFVCAHCLRGGGTLRRVDGAYFHAGCQPTVNPVAVFGPVR